MLHGRRRRSAFRHGSTRYLRRRSLAGGQPAQSPAPGPHLQVHLRYDASYRSHIKEAEISSQVGEGKGEGTNIATYVASSRGYTGECWGPGGGVKEGRNEYRRRCTLCIFASAITMQGSINHITSITRLWQRRFNAFWGSFFCGLFEIRDLVGGKHLLRRRDFRCSNAEKVYLLCHYYHSF